MLNANLQQLLIIFYTLQKKSNPITLSFYGKANQSVNFKENVCLRVKNLLTLSKLYYLIPFL